MHSKHSSAKVIQLPIRRTSMQLAMILRLLTAPDGMIPFHFLPFELPAAGTVDSSP